MEQKIDKKIKSSTTVANRCPCEANLKLNCPDDGGIPDFSNRLLTGFSELFSGVLIISIVDSSIA